MTDEKVLYEIGYKLIPSIAEDALPGLVSELVASVEALGGVISYSELPKLRDLEYVVSKSLDRKRTEFSQAYFGWMRFEIIPAKIVELEKMFASNPSVIRSIILREPASMLLPVSHRPPRVRRGAREEKATTEEASKAMEKEIDALIASTEEAK